MNGHSKLLHRALTERILGTAMDVLNVLKPGLDEKLYEKALLIELMDRGTKVESQRSFPVHYKGRCIGRLVPDLIVDQKVIVEAKVVETFSNTHMAQILGYLAITGLEIGLLLNFKHAKLEWKRVVRTSEDRGSHADTNTAFPLIRAHPRNPW